MSVTAEDRCETCGGVGWIVVGQTMDWPYGEQLECPECAPSPDEQRVEWRP